MNRLVVAVDGSVGVTPAELAAAWDGDDEAREVGLASVQSPQPGEFVGDVVALVVIPLAVNLASSAACALVGRVLARLRAAPRGTTALQGAPGAMEIAASANGPADLVVVVRMAGPQK